MRDRCEVPVSLLVVDDDANNLVAARAVLEPLGLPIVEARSGEEALRRLLDQEFAVVLLDVVMPGMNGFDVAQMMRARDRTRNVPIIFLAAREPGRDDLMRGYLHRAADYLVKPFDPDVLRAKVSVFVDLFRAREQARQLAREEERRVQAERAEQRLRQLLMRTPVAVGVVTGPEHRFELANERFYKLANRPAVEGQPLIEAFPELADTPLVHLLDDLRAAGQPFSATELPVRYDRDRDGEAEQSYFDVNIEVLRGDDGEVRALVGAATDVTDHVIARRVRDDFLGIASHELKTPLTTLRLQADGLANLLARGQASPERMSSKVEIIRGQLLRLERLINELLDVSRIAAGKLPLVPEDFDLAALAREVIDRFQQEANAAGCTIRARAELPVVGRWDRMRLDQVLTNLITNAMKYGRGTPIEVIIEGEPGRARIAVADHGIGIAPEHQARIFERFERAASPREFGGLGLGLWIVARVVQESGGTVKVDSELGKGARFTVELPR
jgi:signal transduction histidine kinase